MHLAWVSVSPADAREVTLLRFDQAAGPDITGTILESPLETALRLHLQSLGQSFASAGAETIRASAVRVRERGFERRLHDERLATARFRQSGCSTYGYTPAGWLPPAVETRRSAYFATVAAIACEAGVPVLLLDAVIAQESGYNAQAVSSAGAKGMMQIMPETGRLLGLRLPFDAKANMRAGARYLRQQIERFGRIDLALAAYNAGPERRSLAAGLLPAIPETITYVRTITRNWARLTRQTTVSSTFQALARTASRRGGHGWTPSRGNAPQPDRRSLP